MHFYAASSWLSSLACLVPGVRRWPERCLVAIEAWWIQTITEMDVCERMQANRPVRRIMKSLLSFSRGIPAFLCDSSLCFPFLSRIWHQSKLRHGQVAMILCVVPLSGFLTKCHITPASSHKPFTLRKITRKREATTFMAANNGWFKVDFGRKEENKNST